MNNPLFIALLIGIVGVYFVYKEIRKYNLTLNQYRDVAKFYRTLSMNTSVLNPEDVIEYKIKMYILLVVTYNVALYTKINDAPGDYAKFEINANISVYDRNKISVLLLNLWEDINSYSNIGPENKKFVEDYIANTAKRAAERKNS